MTVPAPRLTRAQTMIKKVVGFSDKFLPVIEFSMRTALRAQTN